ncbi:transcriptional regulator in cluster with Zn-dependent hydrolase [Gracilibacillus boraciitolerans JCM 21714]|uniref:Transcriptional regulator in cluster with Zn-dependent hydrolase n=1 Tax=Gracilibacillus boraciitolerans JCM 21714 TaxID=1298598 RepID=W4VFL6_9BACI|nr:GntR family transcriptional regulator [Gracilibacillus boraciitolerans]GAE91554.1 transcriptional regulator in cluster with Zn-dependent hydrolase [Gracilibacillus boraciitolerans JCM 21714]
MRSNLNNDSAVSVVQQIKNLIENGYYKEKEKLPTEYELAKELDVSRKEINDAFMILEDEKILLRRPGVGVFVHAKPILSSGIEQLGSVTEMIRQSGKVPGVQYISAEISEPTDEDKNRFDPLEIEQFAQMERVRTADAEPVVYCIDRVDHRLMPLEIIHSQESIFEALKTYSNKEIDYAVAYIEPIGYHERISPILNCEPDQALLLLRQMHYTKDHEPVLYSANFFRSDVFSFYVLRKRL